MAAELRLAMDFCTTPSLDFYNVGATPERTGVSADDHGWVKAAWNAASLNHAFESITSNAFGWWLGYFFMRDVLSDGEYVDVAFFGYLVGATPTTMSARLYNVSGTYKWRLWNVTADTQIGTDSAAQTVGSTLLVVLRGDTAGNQLDLFVNGSNVKSASQTLTAPLVILSGSSSGAATDAAYWSAWCNYFSASDDLNEAHYPEMRLLHPDGVGTHSDYQDSGGGAADPLEWDDLAASGEPDGDTTWNAGQDATEQETHTLTTHTMSNTIQAVAELLSLRDDQADKGVVHGAIIRVGSADKVLSYGQEDLPETYVVREAVFHTEPSTGTWTQALVDGMEAGHRRDAGTAALNVRVTALGVVVVALGTTNLAPPDPPVTPDSGAIPRTSGVSLGSANAMIV